jgi:hypothetical protein
VHFQHNGRSQTAYYSANVFSQTLADGQVNGIPAFDASWKDVVGTLYHLLNEFRTDADVRDAIDTGNDGVLGWMGAQGEIGDQPIAMAGQLGHFQRVFQEVPSSTWPGTTPRSGSISTKTSSKPCSASQSHNAIAAALFVVEWLMNNRATARFPRSSERCRFQPAKIDGQAGGPTTAGCSDRTIRLIFHRGGDGGLPDEPRLAAGDPAPRRCGAGWRCLTTPNSCPNTTSRDEP